VAIERLPEAVRTPSVAKAAVSPSAVVATGAGVAVGLVAGLPVVAALALGAGFWGIRVGGAAAMVRRRRRRLAQPEEIDPYTVPEPWRGFVREAQTAQARFDQAVARCRPGPLQDHLREVARRMSDGVAECWRVAQLGASISAAVSGVDPAATSRQLRQIQEQRRRPGLASGASSEAIDVTEAALATRLQAARRMEGVVQRTADRLQVLTAALDEAVASAVELALDAGDPMAAAPIAGRVDSVVGEIETLRRAMEESSGAPVTGTVPTP
jgi:hypothetical protein